MISPGRSDPKPAKLLNCRPSKPYQTFRQLNHGTLVTIADHPGRIRLSANLTMEPSTRIWCTGHGCSRQEHKLLQYQYSCTRALSLRNLVSGYECGGVFPAGDIQVPRSTGHIMVTTRYSDQQRSNSRQIVTRLYKQCHRPISNRFIKPPYSISTAASIDSDDCRLPTTSVLSNKPDKLRSNQL